LAKKRKTRTSTRRNKLSVLADVATHTVVNEENMEKEDEILLYTIVHILRIRR